MLRKLIIGTVFLVLALMIAPLTAAEEQRAKSGEQTPGTAGSSDVRKDESKRIPEVPTLLRSIPGETEGDKLRRMAKFIKENRPQLFIGTPPISKSELAFCTQCMEDLLQIRNIKAIEPDFVTGPDDKLAMDKVTDKLNLEHCADIELEYPDPSGENPMLRRREMYKFNDVSQIGGPPYRIYNIQLVPGQETKYPVLYYNAGKLPDIAEHTGFARLNLTKCEIENEISGRSEILTGDETLFQVGSNVLVWYKGQVFALMLDYGSHSLSLGGGYRNYCRLELNRLSQPASIGVVCHWHYYR